MKKKLIIAAVVLVATAAIWYAMRPPAADRNVIGISGNIEVTTVDVSFKIPGRVLERPVDEGFVVKKGQLVARLEVEDLAQETAARKAERAAAEGALAELQHGFRREEVAQAKAALDRVRYDADRLRTDFERQRNLYSRGVIAAREFDRSKAAYETSAAAVREAEQKFLLLRRGARPETIDQARARLKNAEAMLQLARLREGYTDLRSPVNGIVLSKNIEPGEQVAAGTPVVSVGLLDEVWLRGYIPETDLGRVKQGQKAKITTDTFPGKEYSGYVSFISQEAEFTPKNVQTERERVKLVYRIKITVPNPNLELKPGMPADAEIHLENNKTQKN
jgi:HlyD family secretion protein